MRVHIYVCIDMYHTCMTKLSNVLIILLKIKIKNLKNT